VHRRIALGVSRDRSGHDAYARLGLYSLAGHNVAGNTETELLAGYDWYEAARDTARLTLGTTLTVWRFTRNQRFETFGHGGYYSPQSYVALSLPAQWSGTRGAWSWRLRAALAWSSTREDDAPFHPTDASLQAAAAAQAAANGLGTAVHAGGHGGGSSVAASGSLECRVTDAWTVGARFQLDRSRAPRPIPSASFRYRINDRGTLQGAPRGTRSTPTTGCALPRVLKSVICKLVPHCAAASSCILAEPGLAVALLSAAARAGLALPRQPAAIAAAAALLYYESYLPPWRSSSSRPAQCGLQPDYLAEPPPIDLRLTLAARAGRGCLLRHWLRIRPSCWWPC
jgi:hypothetical protein